MMSQLIVSTSELQANPSLGGAIKNHLKEMVYEPKTTKSFSWVLF